MFQLCVATHNIQCPQVAYKFKHQGVIQITFEPRYTCNTRIASQWLPINVSCTVHSEDTFHQGRFWEQRKQFHHLKLYGLHYFAGEQPGHTKLTFFLLLGVFFSFFWFFFPAQQLCTFCASLNFRNHRYTSEDHCSIGLIQGPCFKVQSDSFRRQSTLFQLFV